MHDMQVSLSDYSFDLQFSPGSPADIGRAKTAKSPIPEANKEYLRTHIDSFLSPEVPEM